jgi:hypothetical protein
MLICQSTATVLPVLSRVTIRAGGFGVEVQLCTNAVGVTRKFTIGAGVGEGACVGEGVGVGEGVRVGVGEGCPAVAEGDGLVVGDARGEAVGTPVGSVVGSAEGASEGNGPSVAGRVEVATARLVPGLLLVALTATAASTLSSTMAVSKAKTRILENRDERASGGRGASRRGVELSCFPDALSNRRHLSLLPCLGVVDGTVAAASSNDVALILCASYQLT